MILIPISGRVEGLLRFYENHSRRKSFNELKKVNENVLETQKFWIFQRADSVFFLILQLILMCEKILMSIFEFIEKFESF
jgi:hypothetical protein